MVPAALISILLGPAPAAAAELDPLFEEAAEEFGVPAPLLRAMAWEASRGDPDAASAWGGYGMYDFREPGEGGADIERVASLLDVSPDDLMGDAELQIRGAAALLAWYAASWSGGELPDPEVLEDWATAVAAAWGREEPAMQRLFIGYIYDLIDRGFVGPGMIQPPITTNLLLAAPPPSSYGDYYGNADFEAAYSGNYSNYSRSGSDIYYIVIHTVQGSYSGCISWFQNSAAGVSAHYVVRSSDGEVTQMVLEEDVAWHAGNWSYNEQSIGIEHEGYVDQPEVYYTDAMYAGSAALSADIVSRTNVSADRSHIIGHSEVPSATHTDPGSGWDWDYYMALVGGGGSAEAANLMGVVADTDIYNADLRLEGALVMLEETGEFTSTDADGFWSFSGLGAGTYTVTASMDGYEPASCTSDITSGSGDWWCSVALSPASDDGGGDGGGGDDGGGVDTGDGGVDTSAPDDGDGGGGPGGVDPGGQAPPSAGAQFGERVPVSELNPKGCTSGGAPVGGLWSLALLALGLAGRRRRG